MTSIASEKVQVAGFRVRALNLSHFRSYLDAEIICEGRSVVLHGANGAGKTSLLEAVSLFSPGRGLRSVSADSISRLPEKVGWKADASFIAQDRIIWAETLFRPEVGRLIRIGGKPARQSDLGRDIRILWLTPQMDRLWTGGSEGRRKYLDRMAMSFFPSHADAVIGYEKAMRERNRLLRDKVSDRLWYEALESQMASRAVEITQCRVAALERIREAFRQAATGFPTAQLSLASKDSTCAVPESEDVLASQLRNDRMRHIAAGRTLVGPHLVDLLAIYEERSVAADQCSTGEQKALLISLVLANARALSLSNGAPPILLLDEVAAHLDQSRRNALFLEIAALGSQVWMTGTEASLFEGVSDAVSLSVALTDGISIINQEPSGLA